MTFANARLAYDWWLGSVRQQRYRLADQRIENRPGNVITRPVIEIAF